MRPIDADAFKKYIDAQEGRPFIGCTVGEAMKILIDEQPTIQPENAQLSQEGTTKDAISRQAAIDAIVQCTNCGDEDTLRAYVSEHNLDNGWSGGILEALDVVKDLPIAQPKPHEGHWIPVHPIQSDDPGAYMCSKCKTGMWEIRPSSYHYCPNCGAKMTTSTK